MGRTDEQIKKDITDDLYWDTRIEASKIKVAVNDGVVELSGEVPTYSELTVARYVPWRIKGVIDVVDKISVNNTVSPDMPSDEEIKSWIENIMSWKPAIDESAVQVSVNGGVVTLEGSVDQLWKKTFLESRISGLKGILKIENKLAVARTESISDEFIRKSVMASLDRDALVDVENVTAEVDNGVVRLSGNVRDWSAKQSARLDAERTPGVIDIRDDLKIAV